MREEPIFQAGGSQAIRIPKGLRFPDWVREVSLSRTPEGGLLVLPRTSVPKSIQEVRDLWNEDPRATFERLVPRIEDAPEGMRRLLDAGVLPVLETRPEPESPWLFALPRGAGFIDAEALWAHFRSLSHTTVALVGLGVPLDLIAKTISPLLTSQNPEGFAALPVLFRASTLPWVSHGATRWRDALPEALRSL